MTILEIRNELGVYNNILNFYIRTFDLKIFNLTYLHKYSFWDLRDYLEVKQPLYDLLISQSDLILEFSNDYYKWKTAAYISKKIGLDVDTILDYLNNHKLSLFLPTYSGGKTFYDTIRNVEDQLITTDTEIKHISSYQIMKEIQLEDRFRQLQRNT